jgi:hypothetical protein
VIECNHTCLCPTNVGHYHVWDSQNHLQPEVSDMHRLHLSKQGQSGWLMMVRQVRSKSTEMIIQAT